MTDTLQSDSNMMKTAFLLFLLSVVAESSTYTVPRKLDIEDRQYWFDVGEATLNRISQRRERNYSPKNVIVFIGDGMGMTTITASRIFAGQMEGLFGENNVLSFETFPSVGLSKTYNIDKQVPDSASTATAMFSGVKTRHYTLGYDMSANFNRCDSTLNERAVLSSMMTWAQKIGKDTGIVTTTRVTHATPAASYAHINNRDWECDSEIPATEIKCAKDIARQLIEDEPGKNFKVILGGGTKQFGYTREELDDDSCIRADEKNLTMDWLLSKTKAKLVTTGSDLYKVNATNINYLMGLFAPGHLSYAGENVSSRPSLSLMTTKAINLLKKNKNGFVLLVEGGRIDQAHHKNYAHLALLETVEFADAVKTAQDLTDEDDTLIIVTADHSHTMTMNGYPKRGNDILGLAKSSDKVSFETLTYANGPAFRYHHANSEHSDSLDCNDSCSEDEKDSARTWRDVTKMDSRFTDPHYQNMAPIYLVDETHGGEDVPVYAIGPLSHLLEGVYEQNYIGHVISFALCSGPEEKRCQNMKVINNSTRRTSSGTSRLSFFCSSWLIIIFHLLFHV